MDGFWYPGTSILENLWYCIDKMRRGLRKALVAFPNWVRVRAWAFCWLELVDVGFTVQLNPRMINTPWLRRFLLLVYFHSYGDGKYGIWYLCDVKNYSDKQIMQRNRNGRESDTETTLSASVSYIVEGEDTVGIWIVVWWEKERYTSTFAILSVSLV